MESQIGVKLLTAAHAASGLPASVLVVVQGMQVPATQRGAVPGHVPQRGDESGVMA
jgi:hypothetical protein